MVTNQKFLIYGSVIPNLFVNVMRCTLFNLVSLEVSLPVLSTVSPVNNYKQTGRLLRSGCVDNSILADRL